MNPIQPVIESWPVGILMLGVIVSLAVCSISDFIECGLKRYVEKRGFSDPKFNELMESYRVMGMRGSTFCLAKGVIFGCLFALSLYAGMPTISSLIRAWLA